MDRREAIQAFIKRYPTLFTLEPFPYEEYKKNKRAFFVDHARISPPRDPEIAGAIIDGLIVSRKIKNASDLDTLFTLPFFQEKMANKTIYYEKVEKKLSHKETELNIEKLEEAQYAAKLIKQFEKEAEVRALEKKKNEISKLDEEIQKRKEELEDYRSILFKEKIPMPEEEKKVESITDYNPWWEELGLVDDPFFPLEGLSNINHRLWEEIVCKTDIFKKYEQMIEKTPRELFKNTVIYGQFGSGKTTFFDYLNPKLYNQKIYPIYIQLGGEFEVRELIFEFRRQLNNHLSRLYVIQTGNRRVQQNNPIMHAEIDCLQNAGRIGNYHQTVLYSTLMPCYLCAGAVVQFGIRKVVAGESKTFAGAQQFLKSNGVEIVDLDLSECKRLITQFIQANPRLWSEDIGKL